MRKAGSRTAGFAMQLPCKIRKLVPPDMSQLRCLAEGQQHAGMLGMVLFPEICLLHGAEKIDETSGMS
jgi:hypothetical protein